MLVVTDGDLVAAGTTFYSVLGASAGLLTDYSSVWTDYLATDRPIGFFMPDVDAYVAERGLYPADALERLPGPTMTTPDDFSAFGREVLEIVDEPGRTLRSQAREYFRLVQPVNPASHLLDALEERGVLTLRTGSR